MLFRSALAAAALSAGVALAGAVAPDTVDLSSGEVAASLTGAPGDPANGKKTFAARGLGNCLACHANADQKNELFQGDVGPAMDGVAARYTEAQLRAIVMNSKAVFGDQTVMPGFYTLQVGLNPAEKFAGKTVLTAQEVEDVVAYLLTLKE